jgi:hypothetical protein
LEEKAIFWRLPSVLDYVVPPGTTGDPMWQLSKQVYSAACGIWNTYGDRFVPNNPNTAVIRYAWNAACQLPPVNQPPNVPPSPPFLGGQCCDKTYNLSLQYVAKRCNQNAVVGDGSGSAQFTGKLKQILYRNAPPGFNANGLFVEFESCAGVLGYANLWSTNRPVASGACFTTSPFDPQADSIDPVASTYSNVSISTADGSPDTCGNISVPYPPSSPPGTTNYNFTIDEGDSEISIPFTWNGDIKLPITFRNTNVDISFDFGGINFDWHGSEDAPDGNKNPFPRRPPVSRPPGGGGGGGGGTLPKPGDPDVIEKAPEIVGPDGAGEKEEEDDEQIIWLLVEVSNIPDNSRFKIEALTPNNDVVFAGYIAWTAGGADGFTSSPEIPIRRYKTLLKKPEDYTGYKARAINGASLKITEYIQKIV